MMRQLFILLIFLMGVAVLSAQDTEDMQVNISDEPSILHGEDGRFTDPGAVIAHERQFHMLRNRFAEFPGAVDIHYHTSDDGLTWEAASENPIIVPDDVPFDVDGVYASSVIIEDDGTWVLYLYAYPETPAGLGEGGYIIRATADNPLADWAFDEEPVLMPGDEDAWDAFRVSAPSVIKRDDVYLMFYEGIGDNFTDRFTGLARSEDGITWEKHAEPVFTPELSWEADHTHQPRVVDTPDGLVMLYRSYRGRQTSIVFGLATSEDGEIWQRLTTDEPLISQSRETGFQPMWYSSLAYLDGLFAAPLEIRGSIGGTHIYSVTITIDSQSD